MLFTMFEDINKNDNLPKQHTVPVNSMFYKTKKGLANTLDSQEKKIPKTFDDLLADESCIAVDYIIGSFNQRFSNLGKKYTRKNLQHDPEARMWFCYFGFNNFLNGTLRLNSMKNNDRLLTGKYIFDLFKTEKNRYKNEIDIKDEMRFIPRLLPLIQSVVDLTPEQIEKLIEMYRYVKRNFKDIYRESVSFSGKKITYVTHLKEIFLNMIFSGKNLTFESIMEALGHDIVEDLTKYIKENGDLDTAAYKKMITFLRDTFGDDIAFGIVMLSKKSVVTTVNNMVLGPDNPGASELEEEDKEKILEFYKYKKLKKLGKIQKIPEHIDTEEYKELYDKVKNKIREDYFDALLSCNINGFVYFDKDSFQVITNEDEIFGRNYGMISYDDIVKVKCNDVINNLATLHNCSPEKVLRKVEEAEDYVLDFAKEFAPEYLFSIEHWIKYWRTYLSQLDE